MMHLLRGRIEDKRMRALIGAYLRAPMQQPDGRKEKRWKGTPQGGPLSPLLANIYLDPLNKELEKRGVRLLRPASRASPLRCAPGLPGGRLRSLRGRHRHLCQQPAQRATHLRRRGGMDREPTEGRQMRRRSTRRASEASQPSEVRGQPREKRRLAEWKEQPAGLSNL